MKYQVIVFQSGPQDTATGTEKRANQFIGVAEVNTRKRSVYSTEMVKAVRDAGLVPERGMVWATVRGTDGKLLTMGYLIGKGDWVLPAGVMCLDPAATAQIQDGLEALIPA